MTVEPVVSTELIGYSEQTALERQDMHCADLAHHEPESVKSIDIIMYVIVLYSTCTYYTASKQGSSQMKEGDGKGTNRKGHLHRLQKESKSWGVSDLEDLGSRLRGALA